MRNGLISPNHSVLAGLAKVKMLGKKQNQWSMRITYYWQHNRLGNRQEVMKRCITQIHLDLVSMTARWALCCKNIYINNSSVVGPVLSCPAPQDNIFQPQVEGGNGSQTLNKYFPHFPVSSPPVSSPAGGQVVLRRKVSDTDIVLERRRERRQTAAVTRAGCQHTFLTARQMKGKLEGKKSGSGSVI